jgi:hypothetical protein
MVYENDIKICRIFPQGPLISLHKLHGLEFNGANFASLKNSQTCNVGVINERKLEYELRDPALDYFRIMFHEILPYG